MSKKIGVLLVGLIYLSIVFGVLAGCGIKGPLYIPEQRYPQAATTKPDSAPNLDQTNSGTKYMDKKPMQLNP